MDSSPSGELKFSSFDETPLAQSGSWSLVALSVDGTYREEHVFFLLEAIVNEMECFQADPEH